ncbi:MAG: putative baseplate assembly protein, partial [Candidatus Thermofonsia Clade 3 bacterium]
MQDTPRTTLHASCNAPGQPRLRYRLGTHRTFLRRMVARLSQQQSEDGRRPLAKLTTRATDDPSLALLDAAATLADVLTFYQERIVNEGFLR